ncbi:MAG TPA: MmgE/PrpD family protein [Thermoleophilaceae bacterium]
MSADDTRPRAGRPATLSERLSAWAAVLELDDVPSRVASVGRSLVLSQLAAVRAGLGHPLGAAITRAFGPPMQDDPKQSAYVMSALSMSLDFDETFYAAHVGHGTVNVSLAYARALELDGRALLTAIVAATECAARVGAATTLGPFRGQSAAHPHVAGSAAARLRAESADVDRWVDSLGIAMAMPPWMLRAAFLGSDAKVLTAATGVRMGLDACDAAAAGMRGRPEILEHPSGFLAAFGGEVPLADEITIGLGERWQADTITFKLFPASTGIASTVECGMALHKRLDGADVEEVVVESNLLTMRIDQHAQPFLEGADSPVSALQYAVPYSLATAILRGKLTGGDFAPPAVRDPARWELAGKVRIEHDMELTRTAVRATAPIGEALRRAGDRAPQWVVAAGGDDAEGSASGLGEPSDHSFEQADKAIGARVRMRLSDGRELVEECIHPAGSTGPDTRAHHPALVRAKFLDAGGPPELADAVAVLDELSAREVAELVEAAFAGAQTTLPDSGIASSSPM